MAARRLLSSLNILFRNNNLKGQDLGSTSFCRCQLSSLALVENLVAKVESWEKENGMPFLFEKVRLTEMLEDYRVSRQKKEEEKRRSREQKKLQEQLTAEQEVLYGSKPSPLRQFPVKKPLGQSSNANVVGGTPGRRVSTPFARSETSSAIKERKMKLTPIPVNYVSLPKDGSLSHNNSATAVSP